MNNEKDKTQCDFFTSICLKGCDQLRSFLKMSETGRIAVGYSHYHVRDFYIYQILDEIEKVGISLIRCTAFLGDEKSRNIDASENRETRNIISSVIDEQNMWLRKLTEILMEVICFQQSNTNNYFRHYLILQDLRNLETEKRHLSNFYGINNNNIDHQIKNLKKRNNEILEKLDENKIWYVQKDQKGKLTTKFNSFGSRFKKNHKLFNKSQLINMGFSPKFYSRYCNHIHPSLNDTKTVSTKEVEKNMRHLAVISKDILIVCKKLLKVSAKRGSLLAQLSNIERNNKFPDELYKKKIRTNAEQGDFVLVFDHLAEVLEVIKSEIGYQSVKVLFLDRPMIPDILSDVFPAEIIIPIQKCKELRNKVIENIKKTNPKAKIPLKTIKKSLRESILDMWNNGGLKEYYFGDKKTNKKA